MGKWGRLLEKMGYLHTLRLQNSAGMSAWVKS